MPKRNRIVLVNPQRSLFLFLVLPYIFLLLLLLVMAGGFYLTTFNVIYDETVGNIESDMQMMMSILDTRMKEVDNVIQRLLRSRYLLQIKNLRSSPFAEENIHLLMNAMNDMQDMGLGTNFIYDYYTIYFDKDVVIGPTDAYTLDRFVDGGLHLDQIADLKAFWGQRFNSALFPETNANFQDQTPRQVIPYAHTMPAAGKNSVLILLLLDAEDLREMTVGILEAGGSVSFFRDDGQPFLSAGPLPADLLNEVSEKRIYRSKEQRTPYIPSSVTSDEYGFRVVAAVPESHVRSAFRKLNILLSLFTAFVFTLGVAIAFHISIRRTRSLTPVVVDFFANDGSREQMDLFARIAEDSRKRAGMLQDAFIRNLVSGGYTADEAIDRVIDEMGLYLKGDFFFVILVQRTEPPLAVSESPGIEEEVPVIAELLQRELGQKSLCQADSFQGILILPAVGEIRNVEERCSRALKNHSGEREFPFRSIKMGMGQAYEGLKNIHLSYKEALMVIDTRRNREDLTEIAFSRYNDNHLSLYFPLSMEQNLINLTLSHHSEEARNQLDMLISRNADSGFLHHDRGMLLFHSLKSTLLRMINQAYPDTNDTREKLTGAVLAINGSHGDYEAALTEIRSGHVLILNTLGVNRSTRSEKLIQKTIVYIREHFEDSGFGIPMISSEFSISEFHFSREFKKVTGTGFNHYLENLRMEKAENLLRNSRLSIKQIAYTCGYGSSNTFCRAFKRIHGITAGEYQNSRT